MNTMRRYSAPTSRSIASRSGAARWKSSRSPGTSRSCQTSTLGGVILADRLVTDGESPAYIPGAYMEDNGQLARAVERAREALKAD